MKSSDIIKNSYVFGKGSILSSLFFTQILPGPLDFFEGTEMKQCVRLYRKR